MKIIKKIEKKINDENEGIEFGMSIFSEGKYEKSQFRTIVKNVGIKLDLVNIRFEPVKIKDLYFGLLIDNQLKKLYSSKSLSQLMPKYLYPGEIFTLFFYGRNFLEKFEEFKKEQGVFIVHADFDTLTSSKFDGDVIEKEIIYLENGEHANWGSKNYHSFDTEVKF